MIVYVFSSVYLVRIKPNSIRSCRHTNHAKSSRFDKTPRSGHGYQITPGVQHVSISENLIFKEKQFLSIEQNSVLESRKFESLDFFIFCVEVNSYEWQFLFLRVLKRGLRRIDIWSVSIDILHSYSKTVFLSLKLLPLS